jgi:threonine/homoserine/homoserine lactone efflux protein
VEVLDFGLEVVAVSASGVLAPGPLFVTNMLYGAKGSAASGVKMAHGHALVEVCVVTALAAGLFSAAALISGYSNVIALVGGAAILGFAVLHVAGVIKQK